MLKKELQLQLESIEQTANAYFDKVGAYGRFYDFNSLDSDDKARSSELREQIANVVGELFDAIEHSARFDESDQLALRDGNHQADSALRFHKYQRSSPYVPHDEGSPLGFIPGESWEELTDIPSAREELMEGLNAIRKILMRLADTGRILLVKEAAKIACVDPKTIWRWAREPNSFQVIWNKDESRIKGIPEEPFREYRKGRYKNDS